MKSEHKEDERFDWGELAGLIVGVSIVVVIERALRLRDWWRRHDRQHDCMASQPFRPR